MMVGFYLWCVPWYHIHGQIAGSGYIDGIYAFTLYLESDDGLYEGEIGYDFTGRTHRTIAVVTGDTIRGHELDDSLTAIASYMLVRIEKDSYEGEWLDMMNNILLPVQMHTGNRTGETRDLYADRYAYSSTHSTLFTLPISPTVSNGKLLDEKTNEVRAISLVTSFGQTNCYSAKGPCRVDSPTDTLEHIPMRTIVYADDDYGLEARIPDFDPVWNDTMQTMVKDWWDRLGRMKRSTSVSPGRLPLRHYILLDIDYWSDDLIAGSVECLSPYGSIGGRTILFDRKSEAFVSIDDVVKGNLSSIFDLKTKSDLGVSFDGTGIFIKAPFHHSHPRRQHFQKWVESSVRPKKRLKIFE